MSRSLSRKRPWKRVPPFTPVPVRARTDDWTPRRQADFIGYLAETGSVAQAAAHVGCSRESAYRLRRRPGAESFSDAWDVACGKDMRRRKFTIHELMVRAFEGAIRVRLWRGRYRGFSREPSVSAILRVDAAVHRAGPPPGTWAW